MPPVRSIFLALIVTLVVLLCAALAYSGLGQCALCDCKAFAGSKSTNWWCACKHHYDQHYNNKKGPPGGLQSSRRLDGVIWCLR
jgi:hypothetical protein